MPKLQFNQNKILKLQNVLIVEFGLKNVDVEYDLLIEKMQSYIKVKGAAQIVPL